jgi:hypothetical protein
LSSLDIINGNYDKSIKAGWYVKVPKALIIKITNHLYMGRSHNDLKFDSDYNWQFKMAVKQIEDKGYEVTSCSSGCFITTNFPEGERGNYGSSHFKCLVEFESNDRRISVFECLYQFSQIEKETTDSELPFDRKVALEWWNKNTDIQFRSSISIEYLNGGYNPTEEEIEQIYIKEVVNKQK